jgi:hypothetical protein
MDWFMTFYRNYPVKHCVPGQVNRTLTTSGYTLEYLVSAYSLQQRDLWDSENVRDHLADYCIMRQSQNSCSRLI